MTDASINRFNCMRECVTVECWREIFVLIGKTKKYVYNWYIKMVYRLNKLFFLQIVDVFRFLAK